jgi:hypothetical protein
MSIAAILVLLALIMFALAALGAGPPSINYRDAGFAFLTAALLATMTGV